MGSSCSTVAASSRQGGIRDKPISPPASPCPLQLDLQSTMPLETASGQTNFILFVDSDDSSESRESKGCIGVPWCMEGYTAKPKSFGLGSPTLFQAAQLRMTNYAGSDNNIIPTVLNANQHHACRETDASSDVGGDMTTEGGTYEGHVGVGLAIASMTSSVDAY